MSFGAEHKHLSKIHMKEVKKMTERITELQKEEEEISTKRQSLLKTVCTEMSNIVSLDGIANK